MDITQALAPNSDQLDAIELVNPRTFTIAPGSGLGQRDGKTVAEVRLADFPRVWRPSKGMLDVLAACWGTDAKQWVGRRVTLYNDPDVMFGRDKVGGIRISHLSHIDKARTVVIRASGAGRKQSWRVEPLPDAPRNAPQATPTATQEHRPGAIRPDQFAPLMGALERAGLGDKNDALATLTEITGRTITGTRELTEDEAQTCIDTLNAATAGGAA